MGKVEDAVRKRINHLLNESVMKIAAVPNVRKLGYGFIAAVSLQVRGHLFSTYQVVMLEFLPPVFGRYQNFSLLVDEHQAVSGAKGHLRWRYGCSNGIDIPTCFCRHGENVHPNCFHGSSGS